MDARPVDLQEEYKQRFEGSESYRDAIWKILCTQFFSKYVSKKSILLDLGAGWGEFSRNIEARQKYAMDLNPDCGKRIAGHSTFLHQDCSTVWPFVDETLDIVFTSNFFEHLPSKELVDTTLRETFRCLKRGGKIICLGPNIKYVPGSYWDFWDHYIPITEESMSETLSLRGFEITTKIGRFLPYTMSAGWNPPLLALRLYLRTPFLWRLFGKQFLVIARKP